MDWKTLAINMAVMVLSMNPKTAPLVPHVGAAIGAAEDMKGKTGKEKLALARTIVKEGLAGANAVRPGTINIPIADEVIDSAVSAVVDATNVVKKAGLIVNKAA